MMKNFILIFIGICLFGCKNSNELLISYTNPQIEYGGRIDTTQNKGADLYWSGSSVKINFEGRSIFATLKDDTGDNYYNVIIDNDSIHIIRPNTIQTTYLLAKGLTKGKHSVEIFKRTEWDRGKSTFFNFKIKGNAKVLPKAAPKKRKIEFYGNSISAGYAVEDFSGMDSPDSIYTNNYLSYTALTARHFNAEFSCICRSGIGIMISWPNNTLNTMPEIYDRLIPTDSLSTWDFSKFSPDIVVVNLFQNDAWLVNLPNNKAFKRRFGSVKPTDEFIINSYKVFISELRKHYPDANIICILGNMSISKKGSKWMGYVSKAVEEMNDDKIYSHFIPFKGTNGHPSIKEQEALSRSLIEFINNNIK